MPKTRLALALLLAGLSTTATALPSFARRESVSCNTCHTNIPRLTRIGFEYRNAGYRFPENLGKAPRDVTFGDVNAAAVQADSSWVREEAEGASARPRGSLMSPEATIFAATGSFSRWLSAYSEIGLAPGEIEFENAFLRFTYGGAERRLNVRAGVIHPFEGYGASDRPLGLSSPLFRTVPARDGSTGTQTLFAPDFDQAAAEVGYTAGGFNVAATVFNGLFAGEEGAAPFLGEGRAKDDPNYNQKDFQLFANQFFGEAALSAYYYRGTLTTPLEGAPVPAFTDRFDRAALFGTLPVLQRLWLLGGLQWGWNRAYDVSQAAVLSKRFQSVGWFGEAYVPWNAYLGGSLRYDWLDPSRSTSSDRVQAVTASVNLAALDGAQAIVEYQFREDRTAPGVTNTANQVRLRLLYVF